MGVNALFTLVSREQYTRVRLDPNINILTEPSVYFDVDKSWAVFDEVFKKFGPPLNLVFEGDYLPDGLWVGGTHAGFISPELAFAVAAAIAKVEPEHVFAAAAELGYALEPHQELMYREFFFELKIAFRIAVRTDGALFLCIC